ncbi:40S ribosomal protein S4-like [Leptonychotes weddellii]|uniref:40S ribosomal protein S4-like n=1 Tax=Leptonychotes weddellii TaxID=9713 RepID=A0A7F8PZG3_LEPWE|nr:40S ribosomal protein S4-like [Leptonychotes weddellii]
MVVGLGVHKNKRQLHGDIPTMRHYQLHLDLVGHQDSQHLLVGTLLHNGAGSQVGVLVLELPIEGKTMLLPVVTEQQAMACGPKKHLKLVVVPKQWMLDKLTGVFVPHPSTRPHKLRECLHLIIFLKNGLKYVLTENELKKICLQCFIKTDGKVQTDITYPVGFMDVISTDKTGENFHLIYDTKGCFALHWITPEEAKYKLCKERKIFVGTKGIAHLVIHDVHTIRCPDPLIQVNDTIQIDLETGKITDFIKFDTGNLCMISRCANLGRIGVIISRERHPGSFDVVHVKDANGNSFATQLFNIFFLLAKATNHGFLFPVERVSAHRC